MPLLNGSARDLQDDYVVYVYDSTRFPFFRGESYHQFHPNDVIGRFVPESYLHHLKTTQAALGRLDSTGWTNAGVPRLDRKSVVVLRH